MNWKCWKGILSLCLGAVLLLQCTGCGTSMAAASSSVGASALVVQGGQSVHQGAQTRFTASLSGVQSSNVTWQLKGSGTDAVNLGTIDASGTYTAPAVIPSANLIQVTATDPKTQASASQTVTLLQAVPTVSAAAYASHDSGKTALLTVTATSVNADAVLLVDGIAMSNVAGSNGGFSIPITASPKPQVQIAVQNPGPGAQTSSSSTLPLRVDASALPVTGATARAAARLLAQSTFGPTTARIQQVQASGLQAFLDDQFSQSPTLLTAVPATLPSWAGTNPDYYVDCYWWNNILTGKDQLRQRVAFALSEIFVVSEEKVSGNMLPMFLNTLSKDAFGNWRDLMQDVTLTPAMGYYLDMMASAKPAAGQAANENYARELMQLFSLGLNQLNTDGTPVLDGSGNPIPNYTPAQVQAFARAYTGWYLQNGNATAYGLPMVPTESKHDTNSKELLNGTVLPAGQTAETDLDGALDNLFQQASLPPFISKQLIQHLVTSNPSPAYVKRVATVFMDNGTGVRGDMTAVIRAILMDPEARELDDASASQPDFGHLQEPILWMSNVLLGTGFANTAADPASAWLSVSSAANAMRQPTHAPDSVFNYYSPQNPLPGSDTLLAPEFGLENTSAVLARLDVASRMVDGSFSNVVPDLAATGTWGKLAANPSDLLDRVNTVFFSGAMSSSVRQIILNAITPMTNNAERARTAIFLAVSSPSFKIRR